MCLLNKQRLGNFSYGGLNLLLICKCKKIFKFISQNDYFQFVLSRPRYTNLLKTRGTVECKHFFLYILNLLGGCYIWSCPDRALKNRVTQLNPDPWMMLPSAWPRAGYPLFTLLYYYQSWAQNRYFVNSYL